ncbi:hypothetical protein QQP08_005563 [Theobroma cacao]|nr:hypothetical protein QQP08_005563 [Theobroma cacao]
MYRMSHCSQEETSKDAHQWNQDEDYSSDKNQQLQQPLLVSKDVHPTSYQSFHRPQQRQTSDGFIEEPPMQVYLSKRCPTTPTTGHSNTRSAQSPSVKAHSAQDPSVAVTKAEKLPPNVSTPKAEIPPGTVDSTETLWCIVKRTTPKNIAVRRTTTSSPPSRCSCCCIL